MRAMDLRRARVASLAAAAAGVLSINPVVAAAWVWSGSLQIAAGLTHDSTSSVAAGFARLLLPLSLMAVLVGGHGMFRGSRGGSLLQLVGLIAAGAVVGGPLHELSLIGSLPSGRWVGLALCGLAGVLTVVALRSRGPERSTYRLWPLGCTLFLGFAALVTSIIVFSTQAELPSELPGILGVDAKLLNGSVTP